MFDKLKTTAEGYKVRSRQFVKIEQLRNQKPTKKTDLLIHLLKGYPTSQLLASRKFNIGDYRDQIYELRKDGYDIRSYEGESSSHRYGKSRFNYHYFGEYPIDFIKKREERI